MIKHVFAGLATALLLVGSNMVLAREHAPSALDRQADVEAEAEFGVLVTAEGAEVTYAYCVACHSERLVAQQGLTRKRWSALLDWMIEEHGMTVIDEPDLGGILDYLVNKYGPDRPNFSKP